MRHSGGRNRKAMKMFRFLAAASAGLMAAATSSAADTMALQSIQTISLESVEGRIDHMAVDAGSRRLYVAALGNNTVEVIDLTAGGRVGTIKGLDEPQGIAAIPDSQRVFIASGGDGKCRIYDSSLKLVDQIDG